jgi:hypothetical protein
MTSIFEAPKRLSVQFDEGRLSNLDSTDGQTKVEFRSRKLGARLGLSADSTGIAGIFHSRGSWQPQAPKSNLGKATMRHIKSLILPLVAVAVVGVFAAVASADNPKFLIGPNYTATTSALTASGKATGLGNSPVSAFLTATSVDVNFQCQNHGQNFAPGHPATSTNVTGPTQLFAPHNGNIVFSVSLPAPVPPSAADVCPSKQWTVVVSSVSYNGVVLHIQSQANPGIDLLSDGPNDFTAP